MRIILASSSPRRKQLLQKISGIEFEIRPSDILEEADGINSPAVLAMILAGKKAQAVFMDGETVLGADTVVAFDGKILGKPHDKKEAAGMLLSLSGKRHAVITGVCLYSSNKVIYSYDESFVEFTVFKSSDIEGYVNAGKSLDKAGSYGLQDEEIKRLIKSVEGSVSNIVGLPIELLEKILGENF